MAARAHRRDRSSQHVPTRRVGLVSTDVRTGSPHRRRTAERANRSSSRPVNETVLAHMGNSSYPRDISRSPKDGNASRTARCSSRPAPVLVISSQARKGQARLDRACKSRPGHRSFSLGEPASCARGDPRASDLSRLVEARRELPRADSASWQRHPTSSGRDSWPDDCHAVLWGGVSLPACTRNPESLVRSPTRAVPADSGRVHVTRRPACSASRDRSWTKAPTGSHG